MTNMQLRLHNVCLLIITGLVSSMVYAQDSAFMACARYTERELRVACLEAALNEAREQRNSEVNSAVTEQYQPYPGNVKRGPTYQDRIETFGLEKNEESNRGRGETFNQEQTARVFTTADGTDELFDEIAALNSFKPNMWDITLSSGQVWRQVQPKRFNLRRGDTVRIYSSSWGDNFRLTTSRLSGFIQVSRIK